MLDRKDLIPGKMYRLAGNLKKLAPLAIYRRPWSSDDVESTLPYVSRLYPLEPFVYLEAKRCLLASDENDPWYELKILTGEGLIGYIQVHDQDFEFLRLGFEPWRDYNV